MLNGALMNYFFLLLFFLSSTSGYSSIYQGTVKIKGFTSHPEQAQYNCHVVSPVKDCEGQIALSGFIGRCNSTVACFQISCMETRCTVKGP